MCLAVIEPHVRPCLQPYFCPLPCLFGSVFAVLLASIVSEYSHYSAMYSPGCGSESISRTTSAALPVVPPKDDHALPWSPVFSRNSTSAGNYAVVLLVVEVSVVFVTYMFLLKGVCTLCASAAFAYMCFLCLFTIKLVVTVLLYVLSCFIVIGLCYMPLLMCLL